MKDYCYCTLFGFGVGICVGAYLFTRNKKAKEIANKGINAVEDAIEEKVEKIKDMKDMKPKAKKA